MKPALLSLLLFLSACSSPPLPPHVISYSGKGTLTVTVQREQPTNILTSVGESLGSIASKLVPFLLP
jgi:hypothetical protein